MTDYISRKAAMDCVKEHYDDAIIIALHELPAADVQEVKRGKWIEDCGYHFRCSICGDRWVVSNGHPLDVANGWNYCPNCGAKLGVDNE